MFKISIFIAMALPCFGISLDQLTLEEKMGQVLMVHFKGEEVNEEARILVQELGVGGIIYYNWANGLYSADQVLALSRGLQQLASQNKSEIPLLIAGDQEGGVVARFSRGFTVFPGNKALGMAGEPALAEKTAAAMGKELRSVGVNFNLAPVVDINCNPYNPVIGIRSFGDTAEVVIPFAKSAIQGYQAAGILTSIKHFPGQGDTETDSHLALPVIHKSKKQLEEMELRPFRELAAQADSVMTAHLLVPSIDPHHCATLSKNILDILRNEIGFQGVVITDSLVMAGVLKNCASVEDAAIRAFNAGCDILLLGGRQLVDNHPTLELTAADVRRIQGALLEAVNKGVISKTRLDEAVQRILSLKERVTHRLEHEKLAQEVARRALKVETHQPIPALAQHKVMIFAPSIVKNAVDNTSLKPSLFFKLNPNEDERQTAQEMAKEADILIVCCYNAWKNEGQISLIRSLMENKKPLALVILRDPIDAALFAQADLILTTFSPTAPSIQAAYDYLFK